MADQADFPDIYIDSSVEAGGVGSEADPYSAFSEINWTTGGDNSIFDYYAGAHSAPVTINFKRDEEWRGGSLSVRYAEPSVLYPLVISSYGSGDLPVFLGSIDISGGATYKWTPTANWASGYKEYGLEAAAGGASGISQPNQVHIDWVRCAWSGQEIGSLDDHGFVWGDPGAGFGFPTVVIRDESGDPDTTAVSIEASDASMNSVIYVYDDNVVIEELDVRGSDGHGIRIVGGSNNVVVQDCTLHHNWWAGYQIYSGSTNCILRRCDISHCKGANISVNANGDENPVLNLIIEDNDIHDADVNIGTLFTEASGIKAFGLNHSIIRNNKWYNNESGGIRFDGLEGEHGCDFNEIYENEFYNNGGIGYEEGVDTGLYVQMELEYSSDNLIYLNYFHDPWGGGPNFAFSHGYTDNNYVFSNIFEGSSTNYWQGSIRFQTGSGAINGPNYFYNNLVYGAYRAIDHGTSGSVVLKNNIVDGSISQDLRMSSGSNVATLTSDNNCFSYGGVGRVRVDDTYYTLELWKSYSAGLGNTCDANSISSDPLLTAPGSEDFSLQAGSPCENTGEILGDPYNVGLLPGATWPDGVISGDRDNY